MLFPAYGFRPELLPLLIYAAVLTGIGISRRTKDNTLYGNIRRARLVPVIPPLVLLAAAAGMAFYFTPQKDTASATQGVYTVKASPDSVGSIAGTAGEKEYFIRIYTDENENRSAPRPLLVLLPPVLGSQAAIDEVSGELRDRGFIVLSCSRRGFDSPVVFSPDESKSERYGISPAEWFRRVHTFFSGTVSASANAEGRKLEEERKEDLLFLLSWIRQNPLLEEKTPLFSLASRDAVFLAGYDAGGSAIILLGNSFSYMPGFPAPAAESDYSQVAGHGSPPDGIRIRGLIAIESYLWSGYREEHIDVPILPADAEWLASVQYGLKRWFQEVKPKKITELGQIPELSIPVLFLVSDRGRTAAGRYRAMFRSYEKARGPAVLISADGAGPLDYSDFPVKYPLVTTLLRGHGKSLWNNPEAPARTAEIITGFAVSVLNAGRGTDHYLRNTPLSAGIMVTPNGAWPPVPQIPNP